MCHGGLGKQDGQPSSEDVGDELIGNLVLKREVHYSNRDVKELKSEQHISYMYVIFFILSVHWGGGGTHTKKLARLLICMFHIKGIVQ